MAIAVAFSASSLPTCTVLPLQGLPGILGSPRPLQWTKKERRCRRKIGFTVTAKFDLKPPPYSLNSLEPHMSQETLEYHWGKGKFAHQVDFTLFPLSGVCIVATLAEVKMGSTLS
ncbi:hypothetical protein F2P56_017914 [Juglans regia]|uniref:Uncharacterized protein n=1 Tax=Juglans regia TaxID=51240 RepID=A0A833UXX5_JUGRE|nr:hypothetical protein F2P56_017914 [Juglans regia]